MRRGTLMRAARSPVSPAPIVRPHIANATAATAAASQRQRSRSVRTPIIIIVLVLLLDELRLHTKPCAQHNITAKHAFGRDGALGPAAKSPIRNRLAAVLLAACALADRRAAFW